MVGDRSAVTKLRDPPTRRPGHLFEDCRKQLVPVWDECRCQQRISRAMLTSVTSLNCQQRDTI